MGCSLRPAGLQTHSSPNLIPLDTLYSIPPILAVASQFSAIAVDRQDNLIVTGETLTTDFPTTAGSFQPVPPGQARHPFIAKLNMATPSPSVCPDSWSLNFGLVPAKTSSTQTLHLKNCGNAALNIASMISSAATVKATQTCGTIQASA